MTSKINVEIGVGMTIANKNGFPTLVQTRILSNEDDFPIDDYFVVMWLLLAAKMFLSPGFPLAEILEVLPSPDEHSNHTKH